MKLNKILTALSVMTLVTVASFGAATAAPKVGTGKDNAPGQLKKTTTTTAPPSIKFSSLAGTPSSSARQFCGILTDTRVACWGNNFYGQAGGATMGAVDYPISAADLAACDPTTYDCSVTVVNEDAIVLQPTIIPNLSGVTKLEVAYRITCALSGTDLYCWGDGRFGELATGQNTAPTNIPTLIPLTGVTDFRTSAMAVCAQNATGVYCWGYDYWSTRTNGAFNPGNYGLYTPTLTGLASLDAIYPIYPSECNIQSGVIYCYGGNDYGQLGNGTITEDYRYANYTPAPGVAVSNITDAVAVSDNDINRCALTATGDAYCWGWNFYGQIGNGTAGVLDPGVDEMNFSPESGHTAPWVYTTPTKVII